MTGPGRRPHLVVVQAAIVDADGYGGGEKTWHQLTTGWARVRYGGSQERRTAAQEAAQVAATFEFDYTPTLAAVLPEHRLLAFDTAWNVAGAVVIGGNREVHITALADPSAEIDS